LLVEDDGGLWTPAISDVTPVEPCQLPGRSRDDGIDRGYLQRANERANEEALIMKRVLLVGVGVLLALAGVIFALQGAGVIGGSAMSGVTVWAVIGPVIAVAGLAMVAVGLRRGIAS